MTVRLPEYFILPKGPDLDDVIDDVHRDVVEEAGARLYLQNLRKARSGGILYDTNVLQHCAQQALGMEPVHKNNKIMDRSHTLANSVLSGMLFGHVVNEGVYPGIGTTNTPYKRFWVNAAMLGESEQEYDLLGGVATREGAVFGYRVMADYVLNSLSGRSIGQVESWSQDVIPWRDMRENFVFGFGLALYAGWDVYTDLLLAEGRHEEVELIQSANVIDGGQS